MVTSDAIRFDRKDVLPTYIVDSLIAFANHFKDKRRYLPDICGLILNSCSWDFENLIIQLNKWLDKFNMDPSRRLISQIIETAFKNCLNDSDIKKLRGGFVEALVIGLYGGFDTINNNEKFGWGAHVIIKDDDKDFPVIYNCSLIDPMDEKSDCENRSTVDFGVWNGRKGKFFECKTQPGLVQCKEIKYMEKLTKMLSDRNIDHEILFVFAFSSSSIKQTVVSRLGTKVNNFNFISIIDLEKRRLEAWNGH